MIFGGGGISRFIHDLMSVPESEEPLDEYADEVAVGNTQNSSEAVVLIVDDSKTLQVVLAKTLNLRGFRTVTAYNAEDGLAMAHRYKPDLIMMDVVMPGMNGFQATRKIRRSEDPEVAATPIIIMSGNAEATEQFWSLKIGASDFLGKPFTDQDLFGKIEGVLPGMPTGVMERATLPV